MTALGNNIANQINEAHAAAGRANGTAIAHAIEAGRLLTEARAAVPHGSWLDWLASNVAFSERTAQLYAQMYDRRYELAANPQHVAPFTLRKALRLVSKPAAVSESPSTPKNMPLSDLAPDRRHQLAILWWDLLANHTLLLSAAGWSADRIADYFSIPVADVEAIIMPRLPSLNPDGLPNKPNERENVIDSLNDRADHGIHFLLSHACEMAISHAKGLPDEFTQSLESQVNQHQQRMEILGARMDRVTVDDSTAPLLGIVAAKMTRHALRIEPQPYSTFNVLMELGVAHSAVCDEAFKIGVAA